MKFAYHKADYQSIYDWLNRIDWRAGFLMLLPWGLKFVSIMSQELKEFVPFRKKCPLSELKALLA